MTLCGWCEQCVGGEVSYDGVVLVRPESADSWLLYPQSTVLGGQPFRHTGSDLPERDAETQGFFADVSLYASGHPSESQPPEVIVEWLETWTAKRVRPRAQQGGWVYLIEGGRHYLEAPEALTTSEVNQLQGANIWHSETAERAGFEHAQDFIRRRRAQQWTARRQAMLDATNGFVNPYNFVPLGPQAPRTVPTGHLGLGGYRRSGRIHLGMTALTPLGASGTGAGDSHEPCQPLWADNRWILPGSSIAGPVRAIHEALCDSCLRVVDTGQVPVHRDVATPRDAADTRIGRIARPEGGPVLITLAEPIPHEASQHPAVWVRASDVDGLGALSQEAAFHYAPASGDLTTVHGRLERHDGAAPTRCWAADCTEQHWRTIVSQPLGNRRQIEEHYWLPFYKEPPHWAPQTQVPVEALLRYEAAASGAHDVVVRRRNERPDLAVTGVGTRTEVHARPENGDVMWVTLERTQIARVTPSVIWRDPGLFTVGERIQGYVPCDSPDSLCPSCALFGMAEERNKELETVEGQGEAQVGAYRGHVRFGHAVISEVEQNAMHLVEMGSPRPSAGQFYLDNRGWEGEQAPDRQSRPLREWGSKADNPEGPRDIAGRKFWWSSAPPTNRYRVPPANNAHAGMSSHHRLVPDGATLTATVHFDNLTPSQLGSLLVSLSPSLLRDPRAQEALSRAYEWLPEEQEQLNRLFDHEFVLRLGKGKGIGLGAIRSTVSGPRGQEEDDSAGLLTWGQERYLRPDSEPQVDDPVDYIVAFLQAKASGPTPGDTVQPDKEAPDAEAPLGLSHPERRASATTRLLALLSMLAYDWVPGSLLRYPPDDHPGAVFKFDFWGRTTGAAGTVGHTDYRPVLRGQPSADAVDLRVRRPWLER